MHCRHTCILLAEVTCGNSSSGMALPRVVVTQLPSSGRASRLPPSHADECLQGSARRSSTAGTAGTRKQATLLRFTSRRGSPSAEAAVDTPAQARASGGSPHARVTRSATKQSVGGVSMAPAVKVVEVDSEDEEALPIRSRQRSSQKQQPGISSSAGPAEGPTGRSGHLPETASGAYSAAGGPSSGRSSSPGGYQARSQQAPSPATRPAHPSGAPASEQSGSGTPSAAEPSQVAAPPVQLPLELHTNVVGRRFRSTNPCTVGMAARLVRQSDNPRDSNAVQVYSGEALLGYLPRDVAQPLAQLLDAGLVGCQVAVTEEPRTQAASIPVMVKVRRGGLSSRPHDVSQQALNLLCCMNLNLLCWVRSLLRSSADGLPLKHRIQPSPALLLQVEAAAEADYAQHEGLVHSSLAAALQAAHAWQASTLQRQGSGTGACLCSNFLLIADCVMEQDAHLISQMEREMLQTFKASSVRSKGPSAHKTLCSSSLC